MSIEGCLRCLDSLCGMERRTPWAWARPVGAGLLVLIVVVAAAVTWRLMSLVESELLSMQTPASGSAVVADVTGSRIVLADGDLIDRGGVWGITGPNGYGQVTGVISAAEGRVERGFVALSGSIAAGDEVTFDPNAFPSDPRVAHGMPFDEINVPGDLGVNPAWLIDGDSDTWVVFVHGRGRGGRAESLRSLPTYRKLGFPMLVITYRTDNAAEGSGARRSTWGLDEWRDLEAALDTARLRGARDFVLVGHDLGASIVVMFLHNSEAGSDIRAVVLDSAILDLNATVDDLARDHGIPGFLAGLGKGISRIRYGLEWSQLDQVGRAAEFDPSTPLLLLHGTGDAVSPLATAEAFAAALPAATLERFGGAMHGSLWNSQSVRYDDVLTDFFLTVLPELVRDDDVP